MKKAKKIDFNKLSLKDVIKEKSKCLCEKKADIFKCERCSLDEKQNIFDTINKKTIKWKATFENENRSKCMMKPSIKEDIPCTTANIKAHSISKSKNFSEELDWYKLESGNIFRNEALKFKKYGIGSASTFKGFCKIHDEMFQSADDECNITIDFVNQLVYRQISFEIYGREVSSFIRVKQESFLNALCLILKDDYKNEFNLTAIYQGIINEHAFTNYLKKQKVYIENILVNKKNHLNKLDLKTKEVNKGEFYFRHCFLEQDFKVNISTLYCPKLKVNGKKFIHNEYNTNKNVYIFVLNNNNNPLLIMVCKNKDKDLVDFINDFFNVKKKEERILKYSVLFENVYFSKYFLQKILSTKKTTILKDLYSKHNEWLSFGFTYERSNPGVKNAIKYDEILYKLLKLNNGIQYK